MTPQFPSTPRNILVWAQLIAIKIYTYVKAFQLVCLRMNWFEKLLLQHLHEKVFLFCGSRGYSQHKTLDAKLLDYHEKLFNSRKGLSNFTSVLYWLKGSNKWDWCTSKWRKYLSISVLHITHTDISNKGVWNSNSSNPFWSWLYVFECFCGWQARYIL